MPSDEEYFQYQLRKLGLSKQPVEFRLYMPQGDLKSIKWVTKKSECRQWNMVGQIIGPNGCHLQRIIKSTGVQKLEVRNRYGSFQINSVDPSQDASVHVFIRGSSVQSVQSAVDQLCALLKPANARYKKITVVPSQYAILTPVLDGQQEPPEAPPPEKPVVEKPAAVPVRKARAAQVRGSVQKNGSTVSTPAKGEAKVGSVTISGTQLTPIPVKSPQQQRLFDPLHVPQLEELQRVFQAIRVSSFSDSGFGLYSDTSSSADARGDAASPTANSERVTSPHPSLDLSTSGQQPNQQRAMGGAATAAARDLGGSPVRGLYKNQPLPAMRIAGTPVPSKPAAQATPPPVKGRRAKAAARSAWVGA